MNKRSFMLAKFLLCITVFAMYRPDYAAIIQHESVLQPGSMPEKPLMTPSPPSLRATNYILIDVQSGRILAEKNSEEKKPPASLTKMMTLHVISEALRTERIKLKELVHVSEKAWRTGGSRMFVKEGEDVALEDLLKGVIVASGNDACVALAEHVGGSENSFVDLMNQEAKNLGMNDSHFADSTGLPDPHNYSTAKDLALLGRSLIINYAEYYQWYNQKWFTYNGIRQPNRNRLLWGKNNVDGLKTGHTEEAGFCLVSSATKDKMRLLAVVLGEPSDNARAEDSQSLLNYGFRFFETHEMYQPNTKITQITLYKGLSNHIDVGVLNKQYVTIPAGQYKQLTITTKTPTHLQAPVVKGDKVGDLLIKLQDEVIAVQPLYAMESVPKGGFFKRMKDSLRLTFSRWI